MTAQTHPVFSAPDDLNVKIWRYMDFTKYVSLLDEHALFFNRSDLFSDPYEGAVSHADIEHRAIDNSIKDVSQSFWKQSEQAALWLRQWTYINCWHMNDHESAAMWSLYSKSSDAIAIQSTFKHLRDCLPENSFVGKVNYIDYNKERMLNGSALSLFVHKRKSFEHEREVRAVISEWGSHDGKETNLDIGKYVNVNLENLIEKVYVAPTSPSWFSKLVENITRKYELKFDVMMSSMDKKPAFSIF
jgi:hypothetical protein